jgi:hypothetical protein
MRSLGASLIAEESDQDKLRFKAFDSPFGAVAGLTVDICGFEPLTVSEFHILCRFAG